jgi:glycosyltransferase involved in cell wall biosynthesis
VGRAPDDIVSQEKIFESKPSSSYRVSDFYAQRLSFEEQPLVSVITPVFNGEDYLADCIESVLGQTYQNWEYTIVNNRSTDRTLEIAQSYAARDPRIHIHDNRDFLPLLPNHNHAIRQISPESKYCKVVLADDWIHPECLMKMVALAEANPSVGVVGAYGLLGNGTHVIWRGLPFPRHVVTGREVCRLRLLTSAYVCGAPTATLIRSDFVRKVEKFYDESNLHADAMACFRVLEESDFGFVHQILTFTRTQNESHSTFADRMNTIHLSFLTELLVYGPKYLDQAEYDQRFNLRLKEYYQALAEGLLQMRGKKYWEHHQKRLRELGIPFSWLGLFKGFCMAIWNGLSHPGLAAKSLARWWAQPRPQPRRTEQAKG